jgi:Zn-dependent oligopeptidase
MTFGQLSEEEKLLAVDLKLEFERDGIHLKGDSRRRSTILHAEVTRHEAKYMQNIASDSR